MADDNKPLLGEQNPEEQGGDYEVKTPDAFVYMIEMTGTSQLPAGNVKILKTPIYLNDPIDVIPAVRKIIEKLQLKDSRELDITEFDETNGIFHISHRRNLIGVLQMIPGETNIDDINEDFVAKCLVPRTKWSIVTNDSLELNIYSEQ
ncbi:MAG: hypothetical protein Q9M91_00315 [Candidatus Dojkabacteria bacterium]|nr:hypothetical protein [Candidatus Dojkabacteria bacterium]MDQ7020275.1 hypothetical protein [Candidatus Dojkabacteria bacterium]